MLRPKQDAIDSASDPLRELAAAALMDLIVVSVIWDVVRLATVIPVPVQPVAAAAAVLVKAVFCELGPLLLVRRGHFRSALWLLSISALIFAGLYVMFSGGLRSSGVALEVGLATAAVVLLRPRSALLFGSAIAAFLSALAFADARNLLPAPFFPERAEVRFVNLMAAITVAAIPAGRAISRLRGLSTKHADALRRLDVEHQLLKQSQEQLQSERAHLRTILDSEPECVKLVSKSGICLDINPAGMAMIEVDSPESVIGRRVSSLIHPEFRQSFDELHERAFDGQSGTLQYFVTGARGTQRCLETNVAPLRDGQGNITAAIAVTRDITQQKLQEEALRESEESFRALFECAPFSVLLIDPADLRIVGCNRLAHTRLGYTEEEFLGLNLLDIEAMLSESEIRRIGATTRHNPPTQFESRHRSKEGELVDVSVSTTPLRIQGRSLIYAAFRDITGQKLLEAERGQMTERLRELTGHLEHAREAERKHIAREIHDQLGQQLTGLKMQLNFLFRSGASVQPADQRAIQEQVESAIRSVRSIATELRPGVLDSLGLIAALEWLAQDFEARHHIPCGVDLHEFPGDECTATTVFRVAQEALTNVARHAEATAVEIRLSATGKSVRLEVIDNGVGISAQDLDKPGHFGIVGMRERAIIAGGALTLEPLTAGIRLCLDLPLKKESVSTTAHATAPRR